MSFPTVAVTGDTIPPDQQVQISVTVVEQFTESSPARLRIRFTNEDSAARDFLFGSVPPFGPLISDANNPAPLHVLPDDDTVHPAGLYANVIPHSPVNGCWQLATRYDIVDRGFRWPAGPNATISTTYTVLSDSAASDCLSPGEYQFESEWGERHEEGKETWYPWRFTLILEQ